MSPSRKTSKKGVYTLTLKDNGSNWVLYRQEMQNFIFGFESSYQRHLVSCAKPPVEPSKDASEIDLEEFEEQMDKYIHIQSSICSIILSSLSDIMKNCILSEETPSGMWDKLCSIYENQSTLIQADILSQIYAITCLE